MKNNILHFVQTFGLLGFGAFLLFHDHPVAVGWIVFFGLCTVAGFARD